MDGLFISASGIANAQRRNDVRANNIANTGTPGFQASRPQSSEVASGGVRLSSTPRDPAQGSIQTTGEPLDVASGGGFFRIAADNGETVYTRSGRFGLNADRELVTLDGGRVDPPIVAPEGANRVWVARDGIVYAALPDEGSVTAIGQIEVFQFNNPDGLEALGDGLFRASAASGEPVAFEATHLMPGALEGANVNLARELTGQTLDVRAGQANARAFRAQADMLGELLDLLG